jgi:hypothetical protein
MRNGAVDMGARRQRPMGEVTRRSAELATKGRISLLVFSVAIPQIVLQKSFCTDDLKFCGLQARFSCKDVRGLIAAR